MMPQIGIDILKEFNITKGKLLDPYCGSGSSFFSGLSCGLTEMIGFDLNPLAVLISKVKFTKLSLDVLEETKQNFRNEIFEFIKNEKNIDIKTINPPQVTNIDFWFSKEVITNLAIVKHFIDRIKDEIVKNFFLLAFSETVRECSYTRNNEFKLYRLKEEDILDFNPDVIGFYFKKLKSLISNYKAFYYPKLTEKVKIDIRNSEFQRTGELFDVVLTSPPYGDSKTTVSYGQFSALSNEWLGIRNARKIDALLIGGSKSKNIISKSVIANYVFEISKKDNKRALEVSSFYNDLGISIKKVAGGIKKGGVSIYIVGNRTVKGVQLPTDQFIAEKFEENGFKHMITYKRALSNKFMPSRNSPSNEVGKVANTMLCEYIIVCKKV
uniref:site-specific DNA-methyltransferase (cytosine-N(4)-specific) n=1 Tax=Candidatus Endomicrobium sp. MdMp-027 TaxID=1837116 RepID=A0A1C9ZT89_9BACT|nr:type II modification methylase [Candidatus Endomicrobium sp. MdMp-027]BAV59361.1 modification methylase [Candidatus Endomicrobium sp. MdMp-027]